MTGLDWNVILAPVLTVLVMTIAGFLGLVLTGLTDRLKRYFDAKGNAQASNIVSAASSIVQSAMQNEAGQIALKIQTGQIKASDALEIQDLVVEAAKRIRGKVPDSLAKLNPAPGSIEAGVSGKITAAMPAAAPTQPMVVAMPPAAHASLSSDSFQARAAGVVSRLMADLGLTREQAAGIVGNLGQESGLLPINEIRPVSGRGGFGWAQWTGPRRVAFEDWAKAHGTSVTEPEANYGFLIEELRGPEAAALAALRQTTTLEEATQVFEEKFERAGVIALSRRIDYAQKALAA